MVLKKGGDVSAFEKALDQAVEQWADVKSLVSKRSLEVRELDETVTRQEVVAALCIPLGKPDLGDQCRLYKRFGDVRAAVVRLTEVLIRAEKMSPMLRGAVLAQYLGRRSGGCGVESEVSTAQPQERDGSPETSDAD